ncbi:MAG: family 1 encapsulin nanocompartment shell protein [Ignisphaera sp.]|nr:encapsulin [Ignisphaera sp.]MDW8085693.1 family 1 encapsulin nanocompartment shell protein [Ignisphaera sp.]
MMSKHPLDLTPGRKLSHEEVAEALRLSIIAELDAINLYLQIARAIEDEKVRRIFEDVAKEEKTHVGEFLAVLKNMDPEQVEELKKGAEEVREIAGIASVDPQQSMNDFEEVEGLSSSERRYVLEQIVRVADSVRVFRHGLPTVKVGRGVDAVPLEKAGARVVVVLEEISRGFVITQRAIDYSRAAKQPLDIGDAIRAASELAMDEDRKVLEKLITTEGTVRLSITGWDEPGTAVAEVSKALQELLKNGVVGPYMLFVSPTRYAKLVAVYERTGVMELTRLKSLVKDVIAAPILPDDTAVVVASTPVVLDVVIGGDTEVEYIGPEDGVHRFRVWETIAVRVRNPRGIAILKQP